MHLNERRDKREPLGPKNARFWFLHPCTCEWVKLTLKPGQRLAWFHGGQTDEGFSEETIEFSYLSHWAPPVVKCEGFSRSRDCDGLHHHGYEFFATLDNLAVEDRPIEYWDAKTHSFEVESWIKIPDWKKLREHQRDFTAEAAGY